MFAPPTIAELTDRMLKAHVEPLDGAEPEVEPYEVLNGFRTDPRTAELGVAYFAPNGITSVLDAPLIRDDRLVGVLCHEHVGPARTWTDPVLWVDCGSGARVEQLDAQGARKPCAPTTPP